MLVKLGTYASHRPPAPLVVTGTEADRSPPVVISVTAVPAASELIPGPVKVMPDVTANRTVPPAAVMPAVEEMEPAVLSRSTPPAVALMAPLCVMLPPAFNWKELEVTAPKLMAVVFLTDTAPPLVTVR